MATVVPTSSNEHISVVKATAAKYFKGSTDKTIRKRLWLSMLRKYGQIELNADPGHSLVWPVEYSQPEVRQYGDGGDQEFTNHDAFLQMHTDVRGYTATDFLSQKQFKMNNGKNKIVDLYSGKTKRLEKAMQDKFCGELYIDGNAAGNENRIHGIESFMAIKSGSTTVAADKIAQPGDTYAGQSTELQANSGTWSTNKAVSPNAELATDWPEGNGDSEYDPLSPLLVNYSSTSWSSGNTNWIDNCESVLRYAGNVCQVKNGDPNVPFCHMLNVSLWTDFQEYYSARMRINVPHKQSDDLGFPNTLNFEGSLVHFEFDAPSDVGYGLSPSAMELFVMGDQLFTPDGPEYSMAKKGYLYEVAFWGNTRFDPKSFAKYAAVA